MLGYSTGFYALDVWEQTDSQRNKLSICKVYTDEQISKEYGINESVYQLPYLVYSKINYKIMVFPCRSSRLTVVNPL